MTPSRVFVAGLITMTACVSPPEAPPNDVLDVELATAVLDAVLDSVADKGGAITVADPRLATSIWVPPGPDNSRLSGHLDVSVWEPVESWALREAIQAHPGVSVCPYVGDTMCLTLSPVDGGYYQTITLGAPVVVPGGRVLMALKVMLAGGVGAPSAAWEYAFIVLERSESGEWDITRVQPSGHSDGTVSPWGHEVAVAALQAALVGGHSEEIPRSEIAVVVDDERTHAAVIELGMVPIADRLEALSCPLNTMRWACSLEGYKLLIEATESVVHADKAMYTLILDRPSLDQSDVPRRHLRREEVLLQMAAVNGVWMVDSLSRTNVY